MPAHGRKLSMLETLSMCSQSSCTANNLCGICLYLKKFKGHFFWAAFHYGQTFLILLFWQCLWNCKYLNIEHQYHDNWSQQHYTVSCRQRGWQTGAHTSLSSEQLRISFTLVSQQLCFFYLCKALITLSVLAEDTCAADNSASRAGGSYR